VYQGSTDANGQFEAGWLPAGPYVIEAKPSDTFQGSVKEVSITRRLDCVYAAFQLAQR
jgi:hypothetical protein